MIENLGLNINNCPKITVITVINNLRRKTEFNFKTQTRN